MSPYGGWQGFRHKTWYKVHTIQHIKCLSIQSFILWLTLSPLGPGMPAPPLSPGIPCRPGGPWAPGAPAGPIAPYCGVEINGERLVQWQQWIETQREKLLQVTAYWIMYVRKHLLQMWEGAICLPMQSREQSSSFVCLSYFRLLLLRLWFYLDMSQKHKRVLSQSENASTYSTTETQTHLVSACSVQGYHIIGKTWKSSVKTLWPTWNRLFILWIKIKFYQLSWPNLIYKSVKYKMKKHLINQSVNVRHEKYLKFHMFLYF